MVILQSSRSSNVFSRGIEMKMIKYGFCLDENNELARISAVTVENKHRHTYHCLECGQEMIPKALSSEKVKPYFAHKPGTECSGSFESYLHKVAKWRIKKYFNDGGSYQFKRVQELPCKELDSCMFAKEWCKGMVMKSFNVRDFYDTIEEEKCVNGYVADLFLSDSKNSKKEGLLIEICVKHPCEPEKIASGMKIIEAVIKDESDIDYILKNGFSEDEKKMIYKTNVRFPDIPFSKERFRFYNFKNLSKERLSMGEITRFTLNKWGIPIISDYHAFKCDIKGKRFDESSIAELDMNLQQWDDDCLIELQDPKKYHNGYQIGMRYLMYYGYNRKNCWLCKYNANGLCTLYKKYNTPKQPTSNHAELCNCVYYRINPDLLKLEKSVLDKYIQPVFVSV